MIPIPLPPEALATPDIANLQEEYQMLMDEFKEAHKQYQKSMQDNSQLRELRGDIDIIEMEKENGEYTWGRGQNQLQNRCLIRFDLWFWLIFEFVDTWANYLRCIPLTLFLSFFLFIVKKRIDRTQSRLDKLSNQELVLEAAHALRIERERLKELQSQLENQMQDIQRATTVIFILLLLFSLFFGTFFSAKAIHWLLFFTTQID